MPRTAHRQAGSKARIADQIVTLIPRDTTVWVEGFVGTAAVTLSRPIGRAAEHINDLNGEIVNLFRVLRNDAQLAELCRKVYLTPYSQEEFEVARTIWADEHADELDPVERALRTLIASWQAIGGKQTHTAAWRLDLKRSWLVSVWHSVPDRLLRTAVRLKHVHIHRRHVLEILDLFGDNARATIYLDPPYPRTSLATREVLYACDMTLAEHDALIERLLRCRARVIVSMSVCDLYDDAFRDGGWWSQSVAVRGLRNAVKVERLHCNWPVETSTDLFASL
ncbi:DNA adenine methylase [Tistrella sp.]|uniref:DNA adenine methylase n=1 Tax=Tistrella sp. TaxID=2024861 RepID=UPI0025FAC11A|nr:DNA adenine methylase [Tistrella sp.]